MLSVRAPHAANGFTLVELLAVVAVIGVISAIAIPAFSSYYEECCVSAAVSEITAMIKEAKQNALTAERYYAIGFNTGSGTVSLIAGRGPDGTWNTVDDQVVRSFKLADKGGGLRFGYGTYGPLPDLAATSEKLKQRSIKILVDVCGLNYRAAERHLESAGGSVKTAIVMALTGSSRPRAQQLLKRAGGLIYRAVSPAKDESTGSNKPGKRSRKI